MPYSIADSSMLKVDSVCQGELLPSHFIMPYHVQGTLKNQVCFNEQAQLFALNIDALLEEISVLHIAGIETICLYPYFDEQLEKFHFQESYHTDGLLATAIRTIKTKFPELIILTEIGLAYYPTQIEIGKNDKACYGNLLEKQALCLATAGINSIIIRNEDVNYISLIRQALNENNFKKVTIISHSIHFASAIDSATDTTSHYFDAPLSMSAHLEKIRQHYMEGADYIMIQPAYLYLDIIKEIISTLNIPIIVNHIISEYAFIKSGMQSAQYSDVNIIREILCAIKRTGVTKIQTYFTKEMVLELHHFYELLQLVPCAEQENTEYKKLVEFVGEPSNSITDNPHVLFAYSDNLVNEPSPLAEISEPDPNEAINTYNIGIQKQI